MTNNLRIEMIRQRLIKAFSPSFLEIIDESHKHAGHIGSQSGGGHFCIRITAQAFDEQKLLPSHRKIYAALDDLMHKEIHALRIQIVT